MKIESATPGVRLPTRWLALRLLLAVAIAALADQLFFDFPAAPGLSLAIFVAVCGLSALVANPVRAKLSDRLVASCAYALALTALIEDVSWLSCLIAAIATPLFALVMITGDARDWPRQLRRALALPFFGAFWLVGDIRRSRRLSSKKSKMNLGMASLATWVAPILLSLLFLSLFASANPLIDAWARQIDPRHLFETISRWRVMFWLLVVCLVWPFIHLRRGRRPVRAAQAPEPAGGGECTLLFGKSAVLRSLASFNALFALQTILDLAYLWGGLTLPDGMSYAAYAHRGAYPLIATALIAAAFVLIAMRPGGPAGASRWIKPLVLIFVAQNILLVISSIFRTSLYIAAYSLSELRLAALIWMALVATGLVLTVIKIAQGKTNKWLLDANALALAVTLYACCFVNFPYVIARYNIAHCAEASGAGPTLDIFYLASLGPQALPAYDDYRNLAIDHPSWTQIIERARAAETARLKNANWRSWSLRSWRLARYFDTYPQIPGSPP